MRHPSRKVTGDSKHTPPSVWPSSSTNCASYLLGGVSTTISWFSYTLYFYQPCDSRRAHMEATVTPRLFNPNTTDELQLKYCCCFGSSFTCSPKSSIMSTSIRSCHHLRRLCCSSLHASPPTSDKLTERHGAIAEGWHVSATTAAKRDPSENWSCLINLTSIWRFRPQLLHFTSVLCFITSDHTFLRPVRL